MTTTVKRTLQELALIESLPHPRDTGFRSSLTWRATGTVMTFLEKTLGINLVTHGLDNLTDNPTLYVVNHFTRAETFIVPYLLYKIRRENARSLAHHSLFAGVLGRYISRLGAVSTREESRNRMIIGDLMTGRKNWVIYPEGIMVKNKKYMDRGKFMLESPDYEGPPHSGAAVLALRAELYKRDYLAACERQDVSKMRFYEERFSLSGPASISPKDFVITPINITYYPIRPQENKVSQLARTLIKDLPARIGEELQVEGHILLGKTDMNIFFCPPISLADYLQPRGFVSKLLSKLQGPETAMDCSIRSQRQPLTNAFMKAIYGNLDVNFDHLFCFGLLASRQDRIRKTDFHNALLLSALEFDRLKMCRLHNSLTKECARIAFGLGYEPLESIVAECSREGVLEVEDDHYVVNRYRFNDTVSFHDIRLRLTAKVIANEFEPLENCARLLARNVGAEPQQIRSSVALELAAYENRHYERDYARYFDSSLSKSPSVGEPFDLAPERQVAKAGVLLIHGYMAAPMEMRFLGESLRQQGYHAYGVRLDGHGTAPRNLADISWKDWLLSVTAGYALLRAQHERVYIVGFSMGGLMALLKASDLGDRIPGIAVINPALRLRDSRSGLVGAANLWNEFLQNLSIESGRFEYVENHPANPEINYTRNYIKGVRQLSRAIEETDKRLKGVTCPTLIVQADADPVVKSESADLIFKRIASEQKRLETIKADSHVIVTNDHRDLVASLVTGFLNQMEAKAID